ncbi:MAG: ATP-grasp domain-containing protein [Pseudomonadales bacterium]|nr:ATP-grasp domain-containing protein [Pseudomonadales bacterium]
MPVFSSLLVANRGEIACRVMRTAKSLGYRCVAVYSEADAGAPHVALADEAICIGPGPVGESYLLGEKIIQAARTSGAQAIHPGYGFLSENAGFAEACEKAGLVFVGPDANAIRVMGNKAESKRCMLAAGVRCVPGYEGKDQTDAVLIAEAKKIGMPIMVKAAAGGGGRGMRLVQQASELAGAIKLARSEAENAFGSGELILEKAIVNPRHVELQVFSDTQGNTVHLGERDCSVQRRHQKVVEEAPCPVMTPELREAMGAQAVAAANSINYRGAGTVEFLLDAAGEFYFLEMNTRLQVEHPVTELVTGLDLVALQLQVAQGQPLGFSQSDVQLNGHAIEVRLYTEDPAQDFLPTAGRIDLWEPASGEGLRVDDGVCSGQEISPFYDPMVAKVIGYGPSREVARRRLVDGLRDSLLLGLKNNKAFLINCLEQPVFINGEATTAFIAEQFTEGDLVEHIPSQSEIAVAAVLDNRFANHRAMAASTLVAAPLRNWSSTGSLVSCKHYVFNDVEFPVRIQPLAHGADADQYKVSVGEDFSCSVELCEVGQRSAKVLVNDEQRSVLFFAKRLGQIYVSTNGLATLFTDNAMQAAGSEEAGGGGRVLAPMHGQVLEVFVQAGDRIAQGQPLLVLEAMKMQHEILSEAEGTVSEVAVAAATQVAADELLVSIEVADE